MRQLFTPLPLLLASGLAVAHDGHGPVGAHWHATDLFGPVMLLVIVAALWWARRK